MMWGTRAKRHQFVRLRSGVRMAAFVLIWRLGMDPLGVSAADLIAVIPDNLLAAYWYAGPRTPGGASADGSSRSLSVFLLDQTREVGLLAAVDDDTRAWIDAYTALSDVCEYPHVLALFDVSTRARADGGHELSRLSAALFVQTGENGDRIERRIQQLLNRYADDKQSALTREIILDRDAFVLRDRRLEDWATVSWCRAGRFYVIAVGEGALPRALASLSKPDSDPGNDWLSARLAEKQSHHVNFATYVDFARLQKAGDDRFAAKVRSVQDALLLGDAASVLLTVGSEGRAVISDLVVRRAGADRRVRLAGPSLPPEVPADFIPPAATWYAVIDAKPLAVYQAVNNALFAAKSVRRRERMAATVDSLNQTADAELEDDLLAHLAGPVVLHDYPRPALPLPPMTILARVAGDASRVRASLDRWGAAVRGALPPDSAVQWNRDDDGVWYVQYGLMGPALTVTDSWLIIGLSPQAVRDNARHLRAPASTANRAP